MAGECLVMACIQKPKNDQPSSKVTYIGCFGSKSDYCFASRDLNVIISTRFIRI